jgi:acyl-CoA thioesterase
METEADHIALATAMWQSDRAAQELGMRLDHAGQGEATLSMVVTPVMANGLGICHGGYIFMLADCALAAASNSYPVTAVGQQCTVTYINPGRLGARLSAEAREVHRQGRNGIYDVHIRDDAGQAIAEFRGHVRLVKALRAGVTDT